MENKFRIFKLSNGYEVWVGKDSYSNDLLTLKLMKANDLWFHVRGASGSHTILKLPEKDSNPPKELIRIAASTAAYYSKARNAKNVNVAYTKGKYVQKYKGAKSGSVVIKNEKMIIVTPGIPETFVNCD